MPLIPETLHWLGLCHMLLLTVTGLGNVVPPSRQPLCVWREEHEPLVSGQFLSTTLCSHHASFIGGPGALPALCASSHTQPSLLHTQAHFFQLSSIFFCSPPPIPSLCSFLQLVFFEVYCRAGIPLDNGDWRVNKKRQNLYPLGIEVKRQTRKKIST